MTATAEPTMSQTHAATRLAALWEIPAVQALARAAEDPSARLALRDLHGSFPALLVALLASRTRQPIIVVSANQQELHDWEEDLRFFRQWLDLPHADGADLLPFPHIETLPYEDRDPQMDIRVQRARVRQWLAGMLPDAPERPILLAPVRSLMRRLPPADLSRDKTIRLAVGDTLDREPFLNRLMEDGYDFRELITGPGQFAPRGGIIDVFPVGYARPIRIELWGDEIDSLRSFEIASQRSVGKLDACVIFPGSENSLAMRHADQGGTLDNLLDLVPDNTLLVVVDPDAVAREAEKVETLIRKRFLERKAHLDAREEPPEVDSDFDQHLERDLPLAAPELVWDEALFIVKRLHDDATLVLEHEGAPGSGDDSRRTLLTLNCLSSDVVGEEPTERLATPLNQAARGDLVCIVCDNNGQQERLRELLRNQQANNEDWKARDAAGRVDAVVGALHNGFVLPDSALCLYTDRELFHRYKRLRRQEIPGSAPIDNIVELKVGDHVVHVDHGIACYRGLVHQDLEGSGTTREYLELRFADNDVLYVPLDHMERVGRYVGTGDEDPTLSKLGGRAWKNAKAKARQAIEDMADELLELYATRQMRQGHAFGPDTHWQHEFEASFVYNETEDQLRSIQETKIDMQAAKPMDRLICGDVGFGKTEVAIRAAFKAVMDGMQVALLGPTTVLTEQHYRTFCERLADYPVTIDLLSRYRTAGEIKQVKEKLLSGEVDIVVGTHTLLGKTIKFKNLGLVIIDEEQRFGVKQKELLKHLRTQVDVLTLSATPIPRTLYMSMSGIRDMSVVNTAPRNRLPIETYVLNWNREQIESAILRELSRGGQVFFVHNKVQTIYTLASIVQEIVPQARVCVGHGQMSPRELEKVMRAFVDGEYDVLVSTTIIESGIDIPNVNTIIMNHADHFGLAQMYQLRGRVGRSHHQAYCYLMVKDTRSLSPKAKQRLAAIQQYNQLGAGFHLALRDLEIRGMGNVLGRQQSGHIAAIGFDLYSKMLRDTIRRLRQKTSHDTKALPLLEEAVNVQVNLGAPALVPPGYVPSGKQRMGLHKRFAQLETDAQVAAMREEVHDMYGRMPAEMERLFDELRVKVLARRAGVVKVGVRESGATLTFGQHRCERFDPHEVARLEHVFPKQIRLMSERKQFGLELLTPPEYDKRLALVAEVLTMLDLEK